MPNYDHASYGNVSYDGVTGGGTARVDFEAPWRINAIRIEGIGSGTDLGLVTPGSTVTYLCVLLPTPAEDIADHVTRYKTLRQYRRNANGVYTVQNAAGECFWREQHGGASQLVRIEPLAAGEPGTTPDDTLPPTRDSLWVGRWAVVSGVGADLTRPTGVPHEGPCALELETTTIAPTSEYPTEQSLRAARERSDL